MTNLPFIAILRLLNTPMNTEQTFKTQGVMAAQAPKSSGGMVAIAVVLLGLVMGGGGVAVWAKSVTDPIAPKERKATLHIDKGTVELRDSKDAAPRKGSEGDLLTEGMVVKVGKDSQAELRFFDASVARLAADTELTIAKLEHDPKKPTEDKVNLMVDVGRVWSRVLNLLSLNAEYKVQSSTTVATVRGTAFDFAVKKDAKGKVWTHVNGAESLVDCQTKGWKGIVKKNEWLHVPEEKTALGNLVPKTMLAKADAKSGVAKGVFFGALELPEIVDTEWSGTNLNWDKEFLDWTESLRQEEARELSGVFSMPIIGGLVDDIAKIRIANASGDEREDLLASYAQRQAAYANVLAEEGDMDNALEAVNELKAWSSDFGEDIPSLITDQLARGEMADKYGDKLMQLTPELFQGWGEENAALFQSVLMENQFRNLEEQGAGQFDPSMLQGFDLKAYQDVIDDNPILKERYDYLQDWQTQFQNLDWGGLQDSIESGDLNQLQDFTNQLNQLQDFQNTASGTTQVKPLPMTLDTFDAPTTTTDPSTSQSVTTYFVIDGPSSLQAEAGYQMNAYLVSSAGTREDVTARTTWTASCGSFQGAGYYLAPALAGTCVVKASVTDGTGAARSTSASVLVEPSLTIDPSATYDPSGWVY